MRARLVVGAVMLGLAALAEAGEPQVVPVAIQPFHARCFDDQALAERVRARLPAEVPVTVGRAPKGPHQTVRVAGDEKTVVVQVTARNGARQVVGTDRRVLPAEGECGALLEMTALIVARAATPLNAREQAPTTSGGGNVEEKRRPQPAVEERARVEAAELAAAEREKERQREAERERERERERQHEREHERELGREEERAREREEERKAQAELAARKAAEKNVRKPIDPGRRRFELEAVASWIFPLDRAPSTATGELSVGYSWPRLGVAVRAGVSDDWSASATSPAGPITVAARRVPLGAELHVDFRVRGGCVRIAGGPVFMLWSVHSAGLPRPSSALLFEPGAQLRASYRWELNKVVLQAGVAADFMFVADDITVGGVGPITRTPLYEISPFVSAGVQL